MDWWYFGTVDQAFLLFWAGETVIWGLGEISYPFPDVV